MKLLAAIIPFLFGLSSTDIIPTVLPVEVQPLHVIATTDAPVWDYPAQPLRI